jgi:hypothetical protein
LRYEESAGQYAQVAARDVTNIVPIKVAFTRKGTAAHTLHANCKTSIRPWMKSPSAEVLERALVYLGMT